MRTTSQRPPRAQVTATGRRPVLAAIGLGLLAPWGFLNGRAGPLIGESRADAIPPAGSIPFRVDRGGSEIGHHVVNFSRFGDDLTVDIEIELTVTFAFLTAYRYRHRNRELWSQGRLVSMETTTDDNGDSFFVQAQVDNGGLTVASSSGTYFAPANAVPSSYWNRSFLERDQIINTQDGRFMTVEIESQQAEAVEAAGRTIDATRYEIGGLAPLTIWYSQAGQWVGLSFDGRGSLVTYELLPGSTESTLADG